MVAVNRVLSFICLVALSGLAAGQSDKSAPTTIFHIKGTMEGPVSEVIPHVEVHFAGTNVDRTITVDDKGSYETNLPFGTYTMTAEVPPLGPNHISFFTKYVRFFRVMSPTTITLNGTLDLTYFCDGVWAGEDAEEAYKDSCGGEDSFAFPSGDGTPFRLEVRYPRRQRKQKSFSYSRSPVVKNPVRVAYNLFCLQADSVDYNAIDDTIRAYGNVLFEDQSGQARDSSAAFKFIDGIALRIP